MLLKAICSTYSLRHYDNEIKFFWVSMLKSKIQKKLYRSSQFIIFGRKTHSLSNTGKSAIMTGGTAYLVIGGVLLGSAADIPRGVSVETGQRPACCPHHHPLPSPTSLHGMVGVG